MSGEAPGGPAGGQQSSGALQELATLACDASVSPNSSRASNGGGASRPPQTTSAAGAAVVAGGGGIMPPRGMLAMQPQRPGQPAAPERPSSQGPPTSRTMPNYGVLPSMPPNQRAFGLPPGTAPMAGYEFPSHPPGSAGQQQQQQQMMYNQAAYNQAAMAGGYVQMAQMGMPMGMPGMVMDPSQGGWPMVAMGGGMTNASTAAAAAGAPDPARGGKRPTSRGAPRAAAKSGNAGKQTRRQRAPVRSLTVNVPEPCRGDGELGWHPALLAMSTIELNDYINKSDMRREEIAALKALRRRIKNRA